MAELKIIKKVNDARFNSFFEDVNKQQDLSLSPVTNSQLFGVTSHIPSQEMIEKITRGTLVRQPASSLETTQPHIEIPQQLIKENISSGFGSSPHGFFNSPEKQQLAAKKTAEKSTPTPESHNTFKKK